MFCLGDRCSAVVGADRLNAWIAVQGTLDKRSVMVDPKTVIVTDPDILGGSCAVFNGTRVPFKNLLDCLKTGKSIDDFLRSFPTVSREQAVAALEYASEAVNHLQAS